MHVHRYFPLYDALTGVMQHFDQFAQVRVHAIGMVWDFFFVWFGVFWGDSMDPKCCYHTKFQTNPPPPTHTHRVIFSL